MSAPVHCLHLFSNFEQGEVRLVVRPELPVGGVQVILGNILAGARMWPAVPPPGDYAGSPVDRPVPRVTLSHMLPLLLQRWFQPVLLHGLVPLQMVNLMW